MASQQKDEWFYNIYRKATIIYSLYLIQRGKSGISFIWYSRPFSDNFIHTATPIQKTWFTWPCLCKSLHLSHIYLSYGQRGTETKTLLRTFKWLKFLLLIHFLSLNRASECFRLTNLTITLSSCPLLFLESGSLWQLSISFGSISTPESLQILITVFSRSSSGILFGISDISALFLRLYYSPFAWIFSR